MHETCDFQVVKFLVDVRRVNVCDVAEAVDIAAENRTCICSALLRANFVRSTDLTLATDAVAAVQTGTIGPEVAVKTFEYASQRGLTFADAVPSAKLAYQSTSLVATPKRSAISDLLFRRGMAT